MVSADGHPISGKIDFTIVTPPPSRPVPSASRTPSATIPPSAASVPESEAAGPAADDEDTAEVSAMGTALLVSPLVLGLLIGVVALVRRRREDR
ncbi:hypothetical protein [Kribbella sp. DT2]|uniref:hypothetical protein n=1 Tax=Kribbella sp. DT2 TaxID=3393427 RepID=UPI003CF3029B